MQRMKANAWWCDNNGWLLSPSSTYNHRTEGVKCVRGICLILFLTVRRSERWTNFVCWKCNDEGARGFRANAHDTIRNVKSTSRRGERANILQIIANSLKNLLIVISSACDFGRIFHDFQPLTVHEVGLRNVSRVPRFFTGAFHVYADFFRDQFQCDVKHSICILIRRHTHTSAHRWNGLAIFMWLGVFSPTKLAHPFQFQLSRGRKRSITVYCS